MATILTKDQRENIREKLDWYVMVLDFIRECDEKDTVVFAVEKVVEGLNEILSTV